MGDQSTTSDSGHMSQNDHMFMIQNQTSSCSGQGSDHLFQNDGQCSEHSVDTNIIDNIDTSAECNDVNGDTNNHGEGTCECTSAGSTVHLQDVEVDTNVQLVLTTTNASDNAN